jgi:hypothetical protein
MAMIQQSQARAQQPANPEDVGGSMRSGYSSSNEKDRFVDDSRFIASLHVFLWFCDANEWVVAHLDFCYFYAFFMSAFSFLYTKTITGTIDFYPEIL